jgi:hypothetical protein
VACQVEYMSATLPCISWNSPIAWPNCLRSCRKGTTDIHAGGHDAERAAAEHGAFVVEAGHQHLGAVADAAQHVFFRHFAVVEEQRVGVGAAHAQLVEVECRG